MGWHWSSPLTVVPSHSSLGFVKRHERGSLSFFRRSWVATAMWPSITTVSTRWHDGSEFIEIEFDDGLQCLGGGAVAEAVGQSVAPGGIFSLQGE